MAIENLKRNILIMSFIGLLFMLAACPSETFCDLEVPIIERLDKIVIAPEKRNFNLGESLQISVSIPSKITDGSNSYDIHSSLVVESSSRFTNISELLEGNSFTVTKGRLINSQMVLDYFVDTDSYEFHCEIILESKGNYRQFGKNELIAFVKNEKDCEYIDLHTNIKGIDSEGFYEFEVE